MHTDLNVWLDHFEYHSTHRCILPPARPDDLTRYECRLIADSIAAFQLHEQSAGHTLLHAARRYEQEHDAAPLAEIVRLILAEEQHHASLLGEFMKQHGLARKRGNWTDRVFRRVRRLAGFELHVFDLLTAELIGKVYYRALEAATGCRQLQALCRMLVADELAHVGFESDLLRAMHARESPTLRTARTAARRAFYLGATLAVWFTHKRVLRAAGYRMSSFVRACAAQYAFYLEPPPIVANAAAGVI
jgi:hypothetical protein